MAQSTREPAVGPTSKGSIREVAAGGEEDWDTDDDADSVNGMGYGVGWHTVLGCWRRVAELWRM